METSPIVPFPASRRCIVPPVGQRRQLRDLLWLAPLTLGVLLVHGFHPWAEDGGLYVAGVEYTLDPSLFPHETAFVTEHLRFSVFASFVADLVRLTHLSLAAVLFDVYLLSTALMLLAALCIASRCFVSRSAQWTAVALLGAWWTLPVAGTSLLLMDPYVTARNLSTPLSLLAVAMALDPWSGIAQAGRSGWQHACSPALICGLAIAVAAAFHPLMAAYALGFVLLLRLVRGPAQGWIWVLLVIASISLASLIQLFAKPETGAEVAAAYSRYYWFLSQWHWFEWLGLLGPVLIFTAYLRWGSRFLRNETRNLCRAGLILAALAVGVNVCFAQEHFAAHAVARLQPLRAFLLLYAVMILLVGGTLVELAARLGQRTQRSVLRSSVISTPALFVGVMASAMFFVQRHSFPASIHIEAPGRTNPNGWTRAFGWVRMHAPPDALFALDARYVNTPGEDAQTFRAIAQRSAIPDFSKDGGEAAITPALAPEWQRSALATRRLSQLSDAERDARLRPFGVHWVVLHADANTRYLCPYRNDVVEVCTLP